RAEHVARGVQASRDRVGPVDIALATAERDRDAGGAILAGALAYRLFLWLLPLALTTVLVFGVASTATDSDPGKVVQDAGLPSLACRGSVDRSPVRGSACCSRWSACSQPSGGSRRGCFPMATPHPSRWSPARCCSRSRSR